MKIFTSRIRRLLSGVVRENRSAVSLKENLMTKEGIVGLEEYMGIIIFTTDLHADCQDLENVWSGFLGQSFVIIMNAAIEDEITLRYQIKVN